MASEADTITCEAPLSYWDGVSAPRFYMSEALVPPGEQQSFTFKEQLCTFRDMRKLARREDLSLDSHGFQLIQHRTALSREQFFDSLELTSRYYKEMEDLIKARVPEATRVIIFDHNVRASGEVLEDSAERAALRFGKEGQKRLVVPTGPVLFPHNDYTSSSGPDRLLALAKGSGQGGSYTRDGALLSEAEASAALTNRFAIIQVWRPIHAPVVDCPLAVCDARSIAPNDLVVSTLYYPDRQGHTYLLAPNPGHRWYFPWEMTRDEALVFKVYDSREDGTTRFTAHSAVNLPNVPPEAPKRESCEVRAFVFFDEPRARESKL